MPIVGVSSKGWCDLTAYMTTQEFLAQSKAAKPAQYTSFADVVDMIIAKGIPNDKAIIIDSASQLPPDPKKAEQAINGPYPRNRAERRRMQHGKKKAR